MAETDGNLQIAREHLQAGRLDEAEFLLNAELSRRSDQPNALHLLAVVASRRGLHEHASALIEHAIAGASDDAQFHSFQREISRVLGRFDRAIEAGRRAVALRPEDAMTHYDLAATLGAAGDIAGMRASAEHAIALSPDLAAAHFMRAGALLLCQEFDEGWREYEWRLQIPGTAGGIPPDDWPRWNGTPMPEHQRLLLFADQGRGDIIQFSRYIPWVAERCPNLAIACPGEMWPVLRQFPQLRVMVEHWHQAGPCAAYVPLGSLPLAARSSGETIPAAVPYLRADPARVARWQARLASLLPQGNRRVGLVWAGGAEHVNDRDRSMRLAQFAPLGALHDVVLVALQKGQAQSQAGAWFGRVPLINLGPELHGFDDTMAVLECLDLLISVDTAVAHLAGAMGLPTWLLVALTPDWRWMLGRDDSPWYPGLRLFRQAAPNDWAKPVGRITAMLATAAPEATPLANARCLRVSS